MAFKEVPKGRVIPFYLTDEGDLYPLSFHNMDEIKLCEEMVAMALNHTIVVDMKTQITDPKERLSIIHRLEKKN